MSESTEQSDNTSFAEAFESSLNFKTPERGEVLQGTIVSISGEHAYVTWGGPTEAIIDAAEVADKDVGDFIEATVVTAGSEIRLSMKLLRKQATIQTVLDAFESGLPVEGKVAGRNKGGFDINIGGLRAFCPLSQIDLGKIQDADSYIGQTFEFRVLELSGDARKFVVSRAALMKELAADRAREAREKLQVGAVVTGQVRNVVAFGAFIDLGGIEGLLHVSEMSHRRIENPTDVVNVGDEITVKIVSIEKGGERISLSRRDLEPSPWDGIEDRYPLGKPFTGKIVRKADFGLFVELEPGVDGLIHRTQLPLGMRMEDAVLEIGSVVSGWIREVDPDRNRIALAMREVATEDPWEDVVTKYPIGRVLEAIVERTADFGVFVEVEPGLTGLIPVSELDVPPGSDPSRIHQPGEKVLARILSVDRERRRMSLTIENEDALAFAAEKGKAAASVSAGESKSAMALALERALEKE